MLAHSQGPSGHNSKTGWLSHQVNRSTPNTKMAPLTLRHLHQLKLASPSLQPASSTANRSTMNTRGTVCKVAHQQNYLLVGDPVICGTPRHDRAVDLTSLRAKQRSLRTLAHRLEIGSPDAQIITATYNATRTLLWHPLGCFAALVRSTSLPSLSLSRSATHGPSHTLVTQGWNTAH